MAKKAEKWYTPSKSDTGWSKDKPMRARRRLMLKAHKNDYLASGRACQSLANVTEDSATARAAQSDAKYFFRMNRQKKRKSK
jgi:hypothetical protein